MVLTVPACVSDTDQDSLTSRRIALGARLVFSEGQAVGGEPGRGFGGRARSARNRPAN
jgi:hypothetical protein